MLTSKSGLSYILSTLLKRAVKNEKHIVQHLIWNMQKSIKISGKMHHVELLIRLLDSIDFLNSNEKC